MPRVAWTKVSHTIQCHRIFPFIIYTVLIFTSLTISDISTSAEDCDPCEDGLTDAETCHEDLLIELDRLASRKKKEFHLSIAERCQPYEVAHECIYNASVLCKTMADADKMQLYADEWLKSQELGQCHQRVHRIPQISPFIPFFIFVGVSFPVIGAIVAGLAYGLDHLSKKKFEETKRQQKNKTNASNIQRNTSQPTQLSSPEITSHTTLVISHTFSQGIPLSVGVVNPTLDMSDEVDDGMTEIDLGQGLPMSTFAVTTTTSALGDISKQGDEREGKQEIVLFDDS